MQAVSHEPLGRSNNQQHPHLWDGRVTAAVAAIGLASSLAGLASAGWRTGLIFLAVTGLAAGLYGLLRLQGTPVGVQAILAAGLMTVSGAALGASVDAQVRRADSSRGQAATKLPADGAESEPPAPTVDPPGTTLIPSPPTTEPSRTASADDPTQQAPGYTVLYPAINIKIPTLGRCNTSAEADLDAPQVSASGDEGLDGADLYNNHCAGHKLDFIKVQGVHAVDGRETPTPASCEEKIRLEPAPSSIPDPRTGDRLCVITQEGNVVVLELLKVNTDKSIQARSSAWVPDQ